jgi:hypothetical protein
MKELQSLNIARLSNLEFGQHAKSVLNGITTLNNATDEGFTNYLAQLATNSNNYDRAMIQVQKSDETEKIVQADQLRDKAVTALNRYLRVFELSENEEEVLAYKSLNTLLKTYRGIQSWNFEEESNGIDNLLNDLNEGKYLASVALLNMTSYVNRLATRNNEFKNLFAGRTQEVALKEVFDVKKLRNNLKTTYSDLADYVLSMSKSKNTDEFNKALDLINTVRKYYSDLLAKRKATTKNTPETPIPPME